MAVILSKRKWGASRPTPGFGLNPSHPLASYVHLLTLFNEGAGPPRDIGPNRYPETLVGTPTWVTGFDGPAIAESTGSNHVKYGVTGMGSAADFVAADFTISVWFYTTSFASSPVLLFKGPFASTGFYVQFDPGSPTSINFSTNQPGTIQTTRSFPVFTTDAWQQVIFSRRGDTIKIYRNGVDTGYLDVAVHISPAPAAALFQVGGYSGSGSFLGSIGGVTLFKGLAFTAAQAANWYVNPYDLIQSPTRRFFLPDLSGTVVAAVIPKATASYRRRRIG